MTTYWQNSNLSTATARTPFFDQYLTCSVAVSEQWFCNSAKISSMPSLWSTQSPKAKGPSRSYTHWLLLTNGEIRAKGEEYKRKLVHLRSEHGQNIVPKPPPIHGHCSSQSGWDVLCNLHLYKTVTRLRRLLRLLRAKLATLLQCAVLGRGLGARLISSLHGVERRDEGRGSRGGRRVYVVNVKWRYSRDPFHGISAYY